jgi:hypothetical protein
MITCVLLNGDWVEGTPVVGEKFKKVNSKGGELISYYAEPEIPKLPTSITKRAFTRRLNPVIREALRNTTDEMAIDIREDLNFTSHPDLSDPDLITSLFYLVYAGFMTQAESDYVLNTPVTEDEV